MQSPQAAGQPVKPNYVKDLALLFGIPLGIAAVVALIVYLPSLSARPAYNFIYSYCKDYNCQDSYSLDQSGKVTDTRKPGQEYQSYTTPSQLAYFDTASGSSRILTYDEARNYTLLNSSKSPDGYTLVHNTSDSGFLFWGDYHDNWQLQNGMKKKTVHLNGDSSGYATNNITFLGWVKK